MKKNIITACFLLWVSFLSAQNENTKWYFGNHAGLDFMTTTPTPISTSASNSKWGCSSIANGAGNILFYTDGMTVYDQSNSVMANGTGLGTITITNNLVYQYSLIAKQPGNSNIYFVFSNCNINPGLGGIYYSVVDMNLAAGMGSVTTKNVLLSNFPSAGQFTSVRHCNGSDVWVISHDYNNSNFRAFRVSSTGVNTIPVISSVGLSVGASSSYMKVSPSGTKLASLYNSSFLTLFDFDASTGVVSNSLAISTQTDGSYYQGAEFSPNGTKLYCPMTTGVPTNGHKVSQWDLCAGSNTAILASQYTVAATYLCYGIQLAPNGKIYVARLGQTSLGVVNNPNAMGAACNYVDIGQSLASGTCSYGLPASISKPSPPQPFTYSVMCLSVNYTNSAAPTTTIGVCSTVVSPVISWSWNFGDPLTGVNNTSTAQNPTHQFSGTGTYTTTLILNRQCYSDTLKQVVNITVPSPTFAVSGPTLICKGKQAVYTATSTGVTNYSWSNGANTNSISVTPTNSITYTVTGTNSVTGCYLSTVVSVSVNACAGLENMNALLKNVTVYPNPASRILIIESEMLNGTASVNETEGSVEITIINQLGQIIFSKKLKSAKEEIDVSNWAKGIYLIKIKTTEISGTKKLVVE